MSRRKKILLILASITIPLIAYIYLKRIGRGLALLGVALGLGVVIYATSAAVGEIIAPVIAFTVNILFRIWIANDVVKIARAKESSSNISQ